MSEPHEIRGPYEAFVVATKRKDGKCPGLEKVMGCSKHEQSVTNQRHAMVFTDQGDAVRAAEDFNANQSGRYYGTFKIHVTFVEEI